MSLLLSTVPNVLFLMSVCTCPDVRLLISVCTCPDVRLLMSVCSLLSEMCTDCAILGLLFQRTLLVLPGVAWCCLQAHLYNQRTGPDPHQSLLPSLSNIYICE